MGAGLGELDAEDATAFSAAIGAPLNEAGIPAVKDDRLRACASTLMPDDLGRECGDCGADMSVDCCARIPRPGEDDSDPALNGWKDTDGRLAVVVPSNDLKEALEVCGREPIGGELVSDPIFLAARSAEMGLDPLGGASPWKVDKLPYVWICSESSVCCWCVGKEPTSTGFVDRRRLSSKEG